MVKVYFTDFWYGNKRTKDTKIFSSIEAFLNWFTDENQFKKSYMSYNTDDMATHYCDKKGIKTWCGRREPYFEIRANTYDTYGLRAKDVTRIDVDGKCYLNLDDGGDKWKYILTNSFVEKVFNPFVGKLSLKTEIDYAD